MTSPELPNITPEESRKLVDEVAELLDAPEDADRRPARPSELPPGVKYYTEGVVTVELGPGSESLL